MGPFADLRVLELTDHRADFCGRMLADFGAAVAKVEPPGGSPSRTLPLLARHGPAAGTSLLWRSYNPGKRGITLDLNDAADRAAFHALACGRPAWSWDRVARHRGREKGTTNC